MHFATVRPAPPPYNKGDKGTCPTMVQVPPGPSYSPLAAPLRGGHVISALMISIGAQLPSILRDHNSIL